MRTCPWTQGQLLRKYFSPQGPWGSGVGGGVLTERCGLCPGPLMSQAKALSGRNTWVPLGLPQSPVNSSARGRQGGRGTSVESGGGFPP